MNLKSKIIFSSIAIVSGFVLALLAVEGSKIGLAFLNQNNNLNLSLVFDILPFSNDLKIVESSEKSNSIFQPLESQGDIEVNKVGFNYLNRNYHFPYLTTDTFAIFDLETGDTINPLKDKNIDNLKKVLPIASITKLMTSVITLENLAKDDRVNINWESVRFYGDQGSLKSGDIFEVWDLLHVLLLESSNDAAEAIAIHYVRPDFISLMNQKAEEIGMESTFYKDASGLAAENISTASDLIKLANYIENNHPIIWEITKLRNYRNDNQVWYNYNRSSNNKNYYGGKNGYIDESKKTLLSIYELPIGQEDKTRKVGIIVLYSDDSQSDTRKILSYILHNLEYIAK